ncbi:hypothetical protein ACGFZK_20580 [Streptomyces sp. NPDC048257]|uniref:hypothetical protein n=1 Tax=Streptomyces sp. NPDC048257 TaxID=3365526 RepID=UPI00371E59AF
MIGEPELDGERGPAASPAELAREVVESEPLRARARARPWWWVAAAVVVTSVLWAGGLKAFGDRPAEPEIRYRVTDDLCAQFEAPTLEGVLGGLPKAAPQVGSRHPALDWASCVRNSDREPSTGSLDVKATVELHKKTDPKAEFALDTPSSRWFAPDGDGWEAVPGLGEQALVTRTGTGDGLQLRVRDGGAVFTVDVMIFRVIGEDAPDPREALPPRPDRDVLVTAAVEDTRALMAALRRS